MRPRGITFIAIFVCIGAVVSLIVALVSVTHSDYLEAGITALLAILLFLTTRGLWTLKRWAFRAATIALAINALFVLYLWLGRHGSLETLFAVLLPSIVALIYLLADREARNAFFNP